MQVPITRVGEEACSLYFPRPKLAESAKSLVKPTSLSLDILRDEADAPKTDMENIQQFKESEEKMGWKSCFKAGIKKVFFDSYSNSSSLKTAFYKKSKSNK